jgi:hypothetical protein
MLLFALLRRLGRRIDLASVCADFAATIGAGAWLLHPFFVSTVLYVVQREAMLPTTFALLALLVSLRARDVATSGRRRAAAAWLCLGVGTCTLLAVLAKANGVLIPLLVLIVHAVLPAEAEGDRESFRKLSLVVLGLPALVVVAWLAWAGIASYGEAPLPVRGWTTGQRLLTEPSILWDYMARLWFVRPVQGSLLHDDTTAATSLLAPWYTGAALIAWIALAVAAWVGRRRFPTLAVAVLFYLGGHLMESTSLSLELYFEHRNYLPAVLMFWPLGVLLASISSVAVRTVASSGIAVMLTLTAWGQASTWGDPWRMASSWANARPDSARAQAYAAQVAAIDGRIDTASELIDRARFRFSDEPQIAINLINIHCLSGALSRADIDYAIQAFRHARQEPGVLMLYWMESRIDTASRGKCPAFGLSAVSEVLEAASANPRIAALPGRRQDLRHLQGQLALAERQPNDALQDFDQALAEVPGPAVALSQAAALGRAGYPCLALAHIRYYKSLPAPPALTWRDGMPWLHDRVLRQQGYWDGELRQLETALQAAESR